jgi:hypothetical protein
MVVQLIGTLMEGRKLKYLRNTVHMKQAQSYNSNDSNADGDDGGEGKVKRTQT